MAERAESWEDQVKRHTAAKTSQASLEEAYTDIPTPPPKPPPIAAPTPMQAPVHPPLANTFGDWNTKFDFALAFLTIWLWIIFVVSNIWMGIGIYYLSQGGGMVVLDGMHTPATFLVAAGGFLGMIRAIQTGSKSVVTAIGASPAATADALRKAAKGGTAK